MNTAELHSGRNSQHFTVNHLLVRAILENSAVCQDLEKKERDTYEREHPILVDTECMRLVAAGLLHGLKTFWKFVLDNLLEIDYYTYRRMSI